MYFHTPIRDQTCPIPCCGSGFKLVTLLAGIIFIKSVPKSLPTLTPFLVCDLRKVSQTLYADSFACITTSYAKSNVKLRHSAIAACDYTNDLPNTNNPTLSSALQRLLSKVFAPSRRLLCPNPFLVSFSDKSPSAAKSSG